MKEDMELVSAREKDAGDSERWRRMFAMATPRKSLGKAERGRRLMKEKWYIFSDSFNTK